MYLITTLGTLVDADNVGSKNSGHRGVLSLILPLHVLGFFSFWNKDHKKLVLNNINRQANPLQLKSTLVKPPHPYPYLSYAVLHMNMHNSINIIKTENLEHTVK